MENEKAKKLVEMLAKLPKHLQDRGVSYMCGMVDAHAIMETEKQKKQETEERKKILDV